jgi:hypothetical protein
LPK